MSYCYTRLTLYQSFAGLFSEGYLLNLKQITLYVTGEVSGINHEGAYKQKRAVRLGEVFAEDSSVLTTLCKYFFAFIGP